MKKGKLGIIFWGLISYKFVICSDKTVELINYEQASYGSSEKISLNESSCISHPVIEAENLKLDPNKSKSLDFIDDEEKEQLEGFSGILSFIDLICEETLKRPIEEQKEFIVTWLSAINSLAQESYDQQQIAEPESITLPEVIENEIQTEKTASCKVSENFDFDVPTLDTSFNRKNEFIGNLKYFKSFDSASITIFPTFNDDSDWLEIDYNYNQNQQNDFENQFQFLIKSKMIKQDQKSEDEEKGIDVVVDNGHLNFGLFTSQLYPREHFYQQNEEQEQEDNDNFEFCREEVVRSIKLELNPELKPESESELELKTESNEQNIEQSIADAAEIDQLIEDSSLELGESLNNSALFTNKMNAQQMEQLQQHILLQVMNRIDQNHPQLAAIVQTERENLQAALGGTDLDALPKMDRDSFLRYLKTSALPKLINSAIKGKTGVDVLKSLSLALKVVNETLGIVEVILKMLIKIIRQVRYFSLSASEIVAQMAREDDIKPLSDLSVSLDSVRETKKSRLSGFAKMFRKGLEMDAFVESKESPFTLSIKAALSTARNYSSTLKKLPDTLLLSLIHTIFAELEKKTGVIRSALAQKKHKTFATRQQSVENALELIYQAIVKSDDSAAVHLAETPSSIFADILFSLISEINLDPVSLEAHITKVTTWIKPIILILDQESQLSVLNYFLTDPEAESSLTEIVNTKSMSKYKLDADKPFNAKSVSFRWGLTKNKIS